MRQRLEKIDIARGIALIGMIFYHLCWDLAFYGYIPPETPQSRAFMLLAQCVAGSFLFLAGFSLFLAHGSAFRKTAFIRRLVKIICCAGLISAATWLFDPQAFVYFGILHAVALTACAGLIFLYAPIWINCLAISACVIMPHIGIDLHFPALWWLGLSRNAAPALDYIPFFPWFACALSGQTAAAFMARANMLRFLQQDAKPLSLNRFMQFLGRNSLAVYLIHQPLLLAVIYVFSCVIAPDYGFMRVKIERSCVRNCLLSEAETLCRDYCACNVEKMLKNKVIAAYVEGKIKAEEPPLSLYSSQCAAEIFAAQPSAP